MARNSWGQKTLGELLNNKFFLENDKPFLVIFDKLEVLEDFFSNPQQQIPEDIKLITIKAALSPAEFIDRQVVVSDFDDEAGWYRHKWIIHVHGEFANDVSKAQSFYYYQLLGEVFVLDGFLDLLMHPTLNLIRSKDSNSVFDKYPAINRHAVKYLSDILLSCIISEAGTFHESLAWLMLFTSDATINPSQAMQSPTWASITSNRVQCTHVMVLLNLIYFLSPLNVPQLEENTRKMLNTYFATMLVDLGIKKFALTDDWVENLTQIVRFIFQYGKPPLQGKTPEKKKGGTLDAFLPTPQDGTTPPEATIQLFQDLTNEWVRNADETLVTRFQQWTFVLRKNQAPPTLTEENLPEYQNSFAFTGIVDVNLATFLLKQQEKAPSEANSWLAKVDDVIKKREKLWEKATRLWWAQRKLYYSPNNGQAISVKELWQCTRQIGQFIPYNIKKNKKWKDLEETAWEIESIRVAINDPVFVAVFAGADYFSYFAKLIEKMNAKYQECNRNLNDAFTNHYLEILQEKGKGIYEEFDKTVWKFATENISKENLVGFIFCDAMRKDFAGDLIEALKNKLQEYAANIIESRNQIKQVLVPGIIPSITNLGWNLGLARNDKLQAKLSGDKLVSGFLKGTTTKVLNDPSAREEWITALFAKVGKKVGIIDIDTKNFNVGFDALRDKVAEEKDLVIPILWYDKIDNHEFTLHDFLEQKPKLLAELCDFIYKLHGVGIKDIVILADHGFIFTSNDKLMKTKPDGIGPLHKRHCISRHVFTEENKLKYPEWLIFPVDQLSFGIDLTASDIKSIILPKDDLIFKSSRIEGQFFIHGGLSFQECDLLHFISHCEFRPTVEIESIEPVEHGESLKIKGKDAYYLREMQGGKIIYLQLQVTARKKGEGEEQLRPLTIKVSTEDSRIKVDPEQEKPLPSGAKRNFNLSFEKSANISTIIVNIKNQNNQTIKKKEFQVLPPSAVNIDI